MESSFVSTQPVRRPKSGRALATWRRTKAIELALAGHSYDDIAKQVGYSNRGTATAWKVTPDSRIDGTHLQEGLQQ